MLRIEKRYHKDTVRTTKEYNSIHTDTGFGFYFYNILGLVVSGVGLIINNSYIVLSGCVSILVSITALLLNVNNYNKYIYFKKGDKK